MVQYTRRIIGFGIQPGDVDGVALCCMFNQAIANKGISLYLSSDNNPLFRYHQWQANLRILDVTEVKSIPYTPTSHLFIERLIGTIRREYLNRLFFWNAHDLERKLDSFTQYYNENRVHQSLGAKHLPVQTMMFTVNGLISVVLLGNHIASGFLKFQRLSKV